MAENLETERGCQSILQISAAAEWLSCAGADE